MISTTSTRVGWHFRVYGELPDTHSYLNPKIDLTIERNIIIPIVHGNINDQVVCALPHLSCISQKVEASSGVLEPAARGSSQTILCILPNFAFSDVILVGVWNLLLWEYLHYRNQQMPLHVSFFVSFVFVLFFKETQLNISYRISD